MQLVSWPSVTWRAGAIADLLAKVGKDGSSVAHRNQRASQTQPRFRVSVGGHLRKDGPGEPHGAPPTAITPVSPRYELQIMRYSLISAAFAALCLALPSTAQVQVFGEKDGSRHCSTQGLWGAKGFVGAMTLTHGQPMWDDKHNAKMEMLKGKINRLGKNLWTTFATTVPVAIGGVTVPAGNYVVGLHCDKTGTFGLAMLDATKAHKEALVPFGPQNWKPEVVTPLKLNKDATKDIVEKMTMTIALDKKSPMDGTFTLAWGPHTLTAAMKVMPAKKAEAAEATSKKGK